MDAQQRERRSILEWDENEVQAWLTNIGFPQYESQIKEHNISGDVLCLMDPDGLKAVGVQTIGQRLTILKNVYLTKLAHNVPIDPDDYVPPSQAERQENITVDKLYTMMKALEKRIHDQEEEIRILRELAQPNQNEESPIQRQGSFKWATYVKPARSPTKLDSPHLSPQQAEYDHKPPPPSSQSIQRPSAHTTTAARDPSPSGTDSQPTAQPQPPRPTRQDSSDNLKSFKVSLDDPTWKVLPAALKKYRINNDNWQNYAMFICYGPPNNRIERCLSYDEKPLLLFQKLKDGKKNPVFMLKHIKDIRSPIAVAQQKHAARKASNPSSAPPKHAAVSGHGRTGSRPPKLEVHDLSTTGSILTGTSAHPGWPEVVMSPATENKERADELLVNGSTPAASSANGGLTPGGGIPILGPTSADSAKSRSAVTPGSTAETVDLPSGHAKEKPVLSTGVSYAVAIYPYMAEQEDEFDVVVGDTFVILSRARGWWVVQRDPTGSGVVDTDTSKQGWVPAGCLLETKVPVASAIAEATAAKSSNSGGTEEPASTPILPLNIISTSFPGIALTDYTKKGDEELDLVKDEALRVFKRYNHWSYAVKEDGGDRGWVPSWFIGKVAPATNGAPVTPNANGVNAANGTASQSMESDAHNGIGNVSGQGQISPMSSAFPPVQTRMATVS
ncbi:hypothetical protein PLICRDRAFT_298178 [Plicaturopsis crispa FD-325 SS-3]|nr:hypothetical protein PLICRDRAFT_298178 [Plicaturopsis crispa FD-325 SS-3]